MIDRLCDPLSVFLDGILAKRMQDDHKLIARKPDDITLVFTCLRQDVCDHAQRLISLFMGVIIIDELKAVEVEHNGDKLLLPAVRIVIDQFIEFIPVINAGQFVNVEIFLLQVDHDAAKGKRETHGLCGDPVE